MTTYSPRVAEDEPCLRGLDSNSCYA